MGKLAIAIAVLAILGMIAAIPASASTLYNNTTASSYLSGADSFEVGFSITDSFTLSSASTITDATFASWTPLGDTLTSIQWAIATAPFGGTTLDSGTQLDPYTSTVTADVDGIYSIDLNDISIGSLSLAAGTYWLQLSDATASDGGLAFWDISYGPSAAYVDNRGDRQIPSETFTIQGNASVTPEPSSFLLLGSGLVGLASMIRRKIRA
jgi:hypothetical protein